MNPAQPEVCGDGLDNDCDGSQISECIGCTQYYLDQDGDGYGVLGATNVGANHHTYTGINNSDCYDTNMDVYPNNPNYYTNHRGDGLLTITVIIRRKSSIWVSLVDVNGVV